jgi:hypothetical protein
MNQRFRNTELLAKLERNPLRAQLARALDVSEIFSGDVEYLSLNKDLSPTGRQNEMQKKLRAAVRENRDARNGMHELKAKLDKKRAAIAQPQFDKSDIVGFLLRSELRSTLRAMDAGARAVLVAGDAMFRDAMLETAPLVSGIAASETFIVDAAKKERLADQYGPALLEIEDLETTITEATAIFDLALVDLKLHSELDDRTFNDLVTPIMNRKNAPWLVKSGDTIMRVRPELKGTPGLHQPATPEEISDGVWSEAEYLASRSRAA